VYATPVFFRLLVKQSFTKGAPILKRIIVAISFFALGSIAICGRPGSDSRYAGNLLTLASMQRDNPDDFEIPSALDEKKFRLSDNRGKVVVLHFLLKTECPYCLRYTQEFAKLAAKSPDVVHVFIKPDSSEEIRKWASHLDKSELDKLPGIYRDADAKLAKQFNVPGGYAFHGQIVHYPALIALDGQGQEIFRHVGRSNSDRMKSSDFVKKLEQAKTKNPDKTR
jgi:thioredoxin-dependent peroxiredoxin